MDTNQKFYISYFANMKNIPEGVEPVCIALSRPAWLDESIRSIPELAPTGKILRLWKSGSIDWRKYVEMYVRDVLDKLDFNEVLSHLGSGSICMMCYERNGEHCHRYLVKRWFELHGIEVLEVSNKKEG